MGWVLRLVTPDIFTNGPSFHQSLGVTLRWGYRHHGMISKARCPIVVAQSTVVSSQ
jgi:hypothetical protein